MPPNTTGEEKEDVIRICALCMYNLSSGRGHGEKCIKSKKPLTIKNGLADGGNIVPQEQPSERWVKRLYAEVKNQVKTDHNFATDKWVRDFISQEKELSRREGEEGFKQRVKGVIEKIIDENDDGLWAGRETADNILSTIDTL